jgi:hypothetical protein
MPINILPKQTPRGRGPEPTQAAQTNLIFFINRGQTRFKELLHPLSTE